MALIQEQGNDEYLAAGLNLLGLIAHYQGAFSRAEAFYEQGLTTARQVGAQHHIGYTMMNMAALALLQGDHLKAEPLVRNGLRLFLELGNKGGFAEGLECSAWLANLTGQPDRAVRLFAAAEALREVGNEPLPDFVRDQ